MSKETVELCFMGVLKDYHRKGVFLSVPRVQRV
jgi:hypothetical protein